MRFVWVFVLLASALFHFTHGDNKTSFDIAFVINTHPYDEVMPPAALPYVNPRIYANASGLSIFMHQFMKELSIELETDIVRIAIVNVYLAEFDGDHPVKKMKKLWSLEEEQKPILLVKALGGLEPIPWKGLWKGHEYPSEQVADDVKNAKNVFGGVGDRPHVPNIIIFLGISNLDRSSVFKMGPERYPGIAIRMIMKPYDLGEFAPYWVSMGSDNIDYPNGVRIGELFRSDLGDRVRKLSSSCRFKESDGACYYRDKQRSKCQSEHVYKIVNDSHPKPGYCMNGSVPLDCKLAKQCDDECEKNRRWSECDCKSGKESTVFKADVIEAKFCEIETRACKCPSSTSSSSLSLGAIVGIVVGIIVFLLLVVVGIIVYMSCRDSQRRRRRSRQPHRVEDRERDRQTRHYVDGQSAKNSVMPSTKRSAMPFVKRSSANPSRNVTGDRKTRR